MINLNYIFLHRFTRRLPRQLLPEFTHRLLRQRLPGLTPRLPRQRLPEFARRVPRQRLPEFTRREPRPTRLQDPTRRSSGGNQSNTTTNGSSNCPSCNGKDIRLESLETENISLKQKIRYLEEAMSVDNVPWLAMCLPAVMAGWSFHLWGRLYKRF